MTSQKHRSVSLTALAYCSAQEPAGDRMITRESHFTVVATAVACWSQ